MKLRERQRDKVEVNITPLIDVVFLLLIFFMVSTTFDARSRIKVQLPQATTEHLEDVPDSITVQIAADGTVAMNDGFELVSSTPKILRRAMSQIAKGRTDMPVVIKADAQASHQSVMTVMDVASQLGLNRITFAGSKLAQED